MIDFIMHQTNTLTNYGWGTGQLLENHTLDSKLANLHDNRKSNSGGGNDLVGLPRAL